MGMFDTFTRQLVLYMVLVVMVFPFLNSYLVFLMRYGPWYVLSKEFYWTWLSRTVTQYWLVTLSHGLGAYAASGAVKSYTWKQSVEGSCHGTKQLGRLRVGWLGAINRTEDQWG
jgi:hypothetical protein